MKNVEFFGLPCSGKTFISTILKNKLHKSNLITHSYSSAFFQYKKKKKNISFSERLSLKYFRYLRNRKTSNSINLKNENSKQKNIKQSSFLFKNPISGFFYNTYINLCKRYSKKINNNLKKIIFQKIENNENKINNKKKNTKLWFTEYFAYQYIVDKYNHKIDVLVDDESIYQKIFIFSGIDFDNKFIKKYFKLLNKPDLLILVRSSKDKILNRSNKRFGSSKFYYSDEKQLNNMIKFEEKLLPIIKKNKNFFTIKNNLNWEKKINEFVKTLKER